MQVFFQPTPFSVSISLDFNSCICIPNPPQMPVSRTDITLPLHWSFGFPQLIKLCRREPGIAPHLLVLDPFKGIPCGVPTTKSVGALTNPGFVVGYDFECGLIQWWCAREGRMMNFYYGQVRPLWIGVTIERMSSTRIPRRLFASRPGGPPKSVCTAR